MRFVAHDAAAPKASRADDWPPRDVPALLNLASLLPVPAPYQRFVSN
jgi:hypothetical protein